MRVLLLGVCVAAHFFGACATADEGFVTPDGVRLVLRGKEYRAAGVNAPDIFSSFIAADFNLLRMYGSQEEARRNAVAAVLEAEKHKIAFIRFWASGFWPVDMQVYFDDPQRYWRIMDEVFDRCRQHNVKLVPTLFWNIFLWPDLCDEPLQAIIDPESKSFAAMRKYASEVVTRYRDDTNVLAWELSNEFSLFADLNMMTRPKDRGAGDPRVKTRPRRVFEDSMTSAAIRRFMKEMSTYVKGIDPNHLVTSGDARVRLHTLSLRESFPNEVWVADTPRQFLSSLLASQPEPLDLFSVHYYGSLTYVDREARVGGAANLEFLRLMVRGIHAARCPVFVGEMANTKPTLPEDPDAAHIRAAIDVLEQERVSLFAVWSWHFPWTAENHFTAETHPLLVERIARFNEKHAGL